ncbi:MAG: 3-hydroxybutyrate dehydrogenase [Halioglobus sp.]
MSQTNKSALVTGAGSGIGLALARDLANNGYTVILSDANYQAVEIAAERLKLENKAASAIQLDVTNDQHIADAIAAIESDLGRIDLLVNNAGVQHVASLEEFPVERWRFLTDVLLVGPAMLTRAVLPMMRQQNYGRIVNIGSIHSLVASPYKSAYVAAKHGLIGFSKAMALETADQDITINTLCPSYVNTPLVEKQIADQARENGITEAQVMDEIMLAPMPKKSFIDVKEMFGALNFLLSPAAKNMTGQQIVLDGGWTAR